MITVDFVDDPIEFDAVVREAIEASTSHFDIGKPTGRDDFVFISPLPWISFIGVDHTMSLKRDDAMPGISWGRLSEALDAAIRDLRE